MRDTLKKSEFTFALKVGLLFSLILFASVMKEKNDFRKGTEELVQDFSIEMPSVTFTNF